MKNQQILGKVQLSKLNEIDLSKIEENLLSVRIKDFLIGLKKNLQLINTLNSEIPSNEEIIYMIIFKKNNMSGALMDADLFDITFFFSSLKLLKPISDNGKIRFKISLRSFCLMKVENLLDKFFTELGCSENALNKYPIKEIYKFATKIDELFSLNNTIKNIMDYEKIGIKEEIYLIEDIYKVNIKINQIIFTTNKKEVFELKLFKEFDRANDVYKGKIKLFVNNSIIEFDDEKFYNLDTKELFNILKLLNSVGSADDYCQNIYSMDELYRKLKIENVVEY